MCRFTRHVIEELCSGVSERDKNHILIYSQIHYTFHSPTFHFKFGSVSLNELRCQNLLLNWAQMPELFFSVFFLHIEACLLEMNFVLLSSILTKITDIFNRTELTWNSALPRKQTLSAMEWHCTLTKWCPGNKRSPLPALNPKFSWIRILRSCPADVI